MGVHKRFRDWCPQAPDRLPTKLKRCSIPITALVAATIILSVSFFAFSSSIPSQLPVSILSLACTTYKTLTVSSVPNNSYAIQDAINNASAGETVYLKDGTYNASRISIDKPISLIGEDPDKTIVFGKFTYGYSTDMAIDVLASNVVISNLTLIGLPGVEEGINVGGSNVKITDNTIENFGTAINDQDTFGNYITISGNNMIDNLVGVFTDDQYGGARVISNNNITANTVDGIQVDVAANVTISNNEIVRNANGLSLTSVLDISVFNNSIANNSGYGIEYAEDCSNTLVHNNDISQNQIGIELKRFNETSQASAHSIYFEGFANSVYYNNFLNNAINAFVQPSGGNVTDAVSWDNGVVGNYWSDYSGKGNYVIDKNNIDYHPLMHQVNISATAPTLVSTILPIVILATVVVMLVIVAVLLLHRRYRKVQIGDGKASGRLTNPV